MKRLFQLRNIPLRRIGHFWVASNLCFKTRLRVKPLIWKWVLFSCTWNSFLQKRLRTWPHSFKSERFWSTETAHCKLMNFTLCRITGTMMWHDIRNTYQRMFLVNFNRIWFTLFLFSFRKWTYSNINLDFPCLCV